MEKTLKSPWTITTMNRSNPNPGEPAKKVVVYHGSELVAKYNGEMQLRNGHQLDDIPEDILQSIHEKWKELKKSCRPKMA